MDSPDNFPGFTATGWTAISSIISAISVSVLVIFNWKYLRLTRQPTTATTAQAAIADLPITHELLRRLPIPEIKRLPHEGAVRFPLDRERTIAMAMPAPLRRELATLEMPSKNREHVAACHECHTQYTRTFRAHCKPLILCK
jgi:hypothetical protein